MDIRQAVSAFKAMDAYGHANSIPKDGMLYSVAGGSGFRGHTEDIENLASFVYFGALYYAEKEAVELNTKPVVYTSRRDRKAASG